MNKLRVFQNVTKRTASGFSFRKSGTVLLLFLLIPYIITSLSGNIWKQDEKDISAIREQLKSGSYEVVNETSLGKETLPLELYVADCLARTMPEDFEMEALKAQAVLLRTNLIPEEGRIRVIVDEEYGKQEIPVRYLRAVAETAGVYLEYEGKPVYGVYFKVSNGSTRNGREILNTEEYPYLQEVLCDRDFLSTEYSNVVTYTLREFEQKWRLLNEISPETIDPSGEKRREQCAGSFDLLRDNAGYVLGIKFEQKWVSGEQFRYEFHLPSADFRMSVRGDELIFDTKGVGHGLGMSQFGANELALQGESYPEILEYFFQGAHLTRAS